LNAFLRNIRLGWEWLVLTNSLHGGVDYRGKKFSSTDSFGNVMLG